MFYTYEMYLMQTPRYVKQEYFPGWGKCRWKLEVGWIDQDEDQAVSMTCGNLYLEMGQKMKVNRMCCDVR